MESAEPLVPPYNVVEIQACDIKEPSEVIDWNNVAHIVKQITDQCKGMFKEGSIMPVIAFDRVDPYVSEQDEDDEPRFYYGE